MAVSCQLLHELWRQEHHIKDKLGNGKERKKMNFAPGELLLLFAKDIETEARPICRNLPDILPCFALAPGRKKVAK